MMKTGLNMSYVKNENRSTILYTLNKYGPLSRKSLSNLTGLTPAAVTKICAALIADGYIKESGEASKEESKAGRKEILLSLCLSDRLIVGINAETSHITYSLSTMDGKNICSKVRDFTDNADTIANDTKDFLCYNKVDCSTLSGIGICYVGSYYKNQYGLWDCDKIKKRLQATFGVPVLFENNVKAFALSELLLGKNDDGSVLFLKWGPGIGSALAYNGKVYSGNDNDIAEIGHFISNPSGVKCRCGRYGCLETETGEKAILSEFDNKLTLDEIIDSDDPATVSIIDQKIDMVALALTNTATIVHAKSIVLFGSMFRNPKIAEKLAKQCMRYNGNLTADMIKTAEYNDKIGYIGSVSICAEKLFFEADRKPE